MNLILELDLKNSQQDNKIRKTKLMTLISVEPGMKIKIKKVMMNLTSISEVIKKNQKKKKQNCHQRNLQLLKVICLIYSEDLT